MDTACSLTDDATQELQICLIRQTCSSLVLQHQWDSKELVAGSLYSCRLVLRLTEAACTECLG